MSDFTVGADPELFLRKGNKIMSAIGLIGGTKKNPKPMEGLPKGFAVQEDNVLVEFNIPPATNQRDFNENIVTSVAYVSGLATKLDMSLSKKASASLTKDQLMNPLAHVFGCDPDFNVWTLEANARPYSEDASLRSAGGHIHIGVKGFKDSQKILLGRWLDFLIGIPFAAADPDTKRLQLYGKPGAIRFKPYGIEYRTPSNYWLFKPTLRSDLFVKIKRAVSCAGQGAQYKWDASIIGEMEKGNKEALKIFCSRNDL